MRSRTSFRTVKSFEDFFDAEEARLRNRYLSGDGSASGGADSEPGRRAAEKRRQRQRTLESIGRQTEFDVREHVLERRRQREEAAAAEAATAKATASSSPAGLEVHAAV